MITNFENIKINNCINIEELYNGKEWIHGNSIDNINITIFLITISSHHLKHSLNCINKLNLNNNVLINVIKDVCPTNKAYNTMVERCKTQWFIQLDEDMEIYDNCIDLMIESIKETPNNRLKHTFLFTFKLIDEYLGLGNPPTLCGIKLYNFIIMQNFKIENSEQSVSQVDKLWHNKIFESGYNENIVSKIVGYHALHRTPYDLLIRYSKSTSSALNPEIKQNSGDKCRILRPINRFTNFTKFSKFYSNVVHHFVNLGFDINIFEKNHKTFYNFLRKYTDERTINAYGMDEHNYFIIPQNINSCSENCLHEINDKTIANLNDKFAIIGIINGLFENYSYSFDKYPSKINDYFNEILKD